MTKWIVAILALGVFAFGCAPAEPEGTETGGTTAEGTSASDPEDASTE